MSYDVAAHTTLSPISLTSSMFSCLPSLLCLLMRNTVRLRDDAVVDASDVARLVPRPCVSLGPSLRSVLAPSVDTRREIRGELEGEREGGEE